MKHFILIILFNYLYLGSNAQNFQWAKNISGNNTSLFYATVSDNLGNTYSTGVFTGTQDFDPSASGTVNIKAKGGQDMFILKLDVSGNFKWVKTFGESGTGGNPMDVILDQAGNIYLSGSFNGTIDFDPGTGIQFMTGYSEGFVLKLDADGNYVYAKNTGGRVVSIGLDKFRNVYITGKFNKTVDFDPGTGTNNVTSAGLADIFITKLDSQCNFVWVKTFGSTSEEESYAITVDATKNIALMGSFGDTVDFDPGTSKYNLTSNGNKNYFILKLDLAGNFVWAYNFENVILNDLNMDNKGNLCVTGAFSGTQDFDPGSGTNYLTSAGNYDMFILKLNNSGGFVWSVKIGSTGYDYGRLISIDTFGVVYASGNFTGTVDFDPGSGTFNIKALGNDNYYVLKLFSNGTFAWANSFQFYSTIGGEGVTAIMANTLGDLFIVGDILDKTDLDPGSGTYYVTPPKGGYSAFIVKLVSCTGVPSKANQIKGPTNVCVGTIANYSVTSSGGAKWYYWSIPRAKILKGQFTRSVTVEWASTSCLVYVTPYNSCGSSDYDTADVKVIATPKIIFNPANPAYCDGSSITLSVSGADSFLWSPSKGLSDTQSQTVTVFGKSDNTYKVRGIDRYGCIGIDSVNVKVNSTPFITTQPKDTNVNVGENLEFFVHPANPVLSYQWQKDSSGIFVNVFYNSQFSGPKTDLLSMKKVKFNQNNTRFRCIISNGKCNDTSEIALLTVNCILSITKQPINQSQNVGSQAVFIAAASGNSANYQWQENNGNGFINLSNGGQYSGANNDTLTINPLKHSQNNFKYRCLIEEEGCMDTSNEAILKVNCVSNIKTHPSNQTANAGTKALFTLVSLSSSSTYLWQQDSGAGYSNLSNSGNYSGVTNDTLIIANLKISQNNYTVRCIVSDDGCFDTSVSALLTVKTIGIDSLIIQKNFSIYPNPANNFITIESSQTPNNLPFIITDQIGKKILNGELNSKTNTVDISTLATGIYFLKIGEGNTEVFKIVKQ